MDWWGKVTPGIVRFLNKLAELFPLIAALVAFKKGEQSGIEKEQAATEAVNAEAQAEYAEIGTQGMTDEELDDKLGKGEF